MIENVTQKPTRIMWILSHTEARKFELLMLKELGFNEIYLPKTHPIKVDFRSASIEFSEDQYLTIPQEDLNILNSTNWYENPSKKAWDIANKYFKIFIFRLYNFNCFQNIIKNFKGIILQRSYGHEFSKSVSDIIRSISNNFNFTEIENIRNRFWYIYAYKNQKTIESNIYLERSMYLPLGLANSNIKKTWHGYKKEIFFVCPDINFTPYYRSIYQNFIKNFAEFPYKIGGTQALAHDISSNILGYLPDEEYHTCMTSMRVMFYHSQEKTHIHYHPFEAIKFGMPVIFMAGGLLDALGGLRLPGRCKNISEAKKKIKKILDDDWSFIHKIQNSQAILLEQMKISNCLPYWTKAFNQIQNDIRLLEKREPYKHIKKKRIAVFVPVNYRGGSSYGAQMLANSIYLGAKKSGNSIEVIFAHLESAEEHFNCDFSYLDSAIKTRSFKWRFLTPFDAKHSLTLARKSIPLNLREYCIPDDGINQFMDCDLWIMISDRLPKPLLPIKPYLLMIYDYIQRYIPIMNEYDRKQLINFAHEANGIIVTTDFTESDALNYANIPASKIHKLPMLIPNKPMEQKQISKKNYFIWTTNLSLHKNHLYSFQALKLYYEKYEGELSCFITGTNTELLFSKSHSHFKQLHSILTNQHLKEKILLKGELNLITYKNLLSEAKFLWHPALIDNGTFSCIDALEAGIPTLSSKYPAMEEMNNQFNLNLFWMDPYDPENMALELKKMEQNVNSYRCSLDISIRQQNDEHLELIAQKYWQTVEDYI